MAEDEVTPEQLAAIAAENEEPEPVNYKPPAQKSVKEIQELDKDDESLRKYKEALLGPGITEADPNAPNVQVTRMSLVCESAPNPLVLDLQGDLEAFKKQAFVLKEGVEYKIKISFKVNKEIVSGLKRYSAVSEVQQALSVQSQTVVRTPCSQIPHRGSSGDPLHFKGRLALHHLTLN